MRRNQKILRMVEMAMLIALVVVLQMISALFPLKIGAVEKIFPQRRRETGPLRRTSAGSDGCQRQSAEFAEVL